MRLLKSRNKEGLNPKNITMKNYFWIFVPGAWTCHWNKGVKSNAQFSELPSALILGIHHDYRICHTSIALEGLLRKGASIKRIQDGQIDLSGHIYGQEAPCGCPYWNSISFLGTSTMTFTEQYPNFSVDVTAYTTTIGERYLISLVSYIQIKNIINNKNNP